MNPEAKHSCIAEFCEKCKQDHCKCTPCASVEVAVDSAQPGQAARPSWQGAELPQLKESWFFQKKTGWFCSSCRLYYDDEINVCSRCGSGMTKRTYYQRTQIEAVTATLIWGILSMGVVWAVMLAGKIFLNIKYHPPLIYDPLNPKLADPNDCSRTSSKFVFKEFWPMLIMIPLTVILVAAAIVVIFFIGAFIVGTLKNIF
jgi:hypothetical protein